MSPNDSVPSGTGWISEISGWEVSGLDMKGYSPLRRRMKVRISSHRVNQCQHCAPMGIALHALQIVGAFVAIGLYLYVRWKILERSVKDLGSGGIPTIFGTDKP